MAEFKSEKHSLQKKRRKQSASGGQGSPSSSLVCEKLENRCLLSCSWSTVLLDATEPDDGLITSAEDVDVKIDIDGLQYSLVATDISPIKSESNSSLSMANGFDVTYGDFVDDMLLPRNGDPGEIPEKEAFAGQDDDMREPWLDDDSQIADNVVINDQTGDSLESCSKYIGEITNNEFFSDQANDMLEPWCEEGKGTTVIDAAPDAVGKNLSQELVFVDSGVHDYKQLVEDILANPSDGRQIDVIILDSNQEGIAQVSETLGVYDNLDAVHFVSHGTNQAVKLGGSWLQLETLDDYATEIESWSDALDIEADLLFYACDLAVTEEGQELIESISVLTGADVAASDDATGHTLLGGDWELEHQLGRIESSLAISEQAQQDWNGLLALPTAANNTVSTHEDTTYTFAANDFGYSDGDGDPMASVKITTLEAVGTLRLNSVDVTLNQVITKADIDNDLLTFTSASDGNGAGYDSFGFSVNDGTSDSASTYTMTMDVT
ncbi:MAG: DUF4347 domain-containing protein, partial [Desulfobulbaceae bacterium]|nr:DUF4347 domain-containing protein [Desulfobulbaceae bacterium]